MKLRCINDVMGDLLIQIFAYLIRSETRLFSGQYPHYRFICQEVSPGKTFGVKETEYLPVPSNYSDSLF